MESTNPETTGRMVISAFEPFGGRSINVSMATLERIRNSLPNPAKIDLIFIELPVIKEKGADLIRSALIQNTPDFLICLGETGSTWVSFETRAINLRDYRIPDNRGNIVRNEPIVLDGPRFIGATLPYTLFEEAAEKRGIPARYSNNAGLFLCNEILYSALYTILNLNLPTQAGFIHLPSEPSFDEENGLLAHFITDVIIPTNSDEG